MSNYGKFSPLAQRQEKTGSPFPDYKRGSSKWFDWIDEIEHYCLNGYTAGGDTISGRHFFKLNLTKIGITNNQGNKVPTFPYYVDSQREFYDKVEYCLKNERNLIGLKGRDKGWTYDVAALALYEMMIQEFSSVMALFPGGTSVAKIKFRAAYDMAYNELDHDFKYPAGLSDSKNLLKYGWKEKDERGIEVVRGSQSSLDMIEAVNSSVVRAGRSKFIIVEELGEIKGARDIVNTADANMREGGKKFGMLIAGGTSNSFNEGFADFRDMWYNPEVFQFEKIFIPTQKAYWGYVNLQTGESDQEGAKAHRQLIRDGKKGKDLVIERQEYPFEEKEAFYQGKNSPYNAELCNAQLHEILTNKVLQTQVERGNLVPKKTAMGIEPVWQITPNGRWRKFMGPGKGLLNADVGGVDGYKLRDVEQSDSLGAIVIRRPSQGIKQPGGFPIMVYHNRPAEKEDFFMDCLLTAMYYSTEEHTCQLLVEYTDEDIITFFKQRNALKYLKRRPAIIRNKWSKATYQYGIKPTEFNKDMALEYSIKDFNSNSAEYVFKELIDEFLIFGTANTDIADANNWAVLAEMDNVKVLDEFKPSKTKRNFMPYTVRDGHGNLQVVKTPQQKYTLHAQSRRVI